MKYYLYDFDGTIYDGDSGVDLILFSLKRYPLHTFKVLGNAILFGLHIVDKVTFKERVFSFLKHVDNIEDFVEDFWAKHEKKLKRFWLDKKDHKKDIIISASGTFWLEYIYIKYQVKDLIATVYDTKTGKIIGNNCHGEEKVRLFYLEYPKGVVNEMYTDSLNDLPMIKEAKQG